MLIRFDGQVALVTGVAQGIGAAIAGDLAEAGARVHAADIDAPGLAAFAAASGAVAHGGDLAEPAFAREMIAAILAREGRLDILALAAGGVQGQTGRPLEEVPAEDWRKLFRANVDSAFFVAQAAAPAMKAQGGGRIVAVASGAGLRPSLTGVQAYAAAKHALVGLVRQLALELGPHGIGVNAVAPGFVLSNPATRRQWRALGEAGQARLIELIHARRLGEPGDISAAVLFLASRQAAWISGQILSVDGGRA